MKKLIITFMTVFLIAGAVYMLLPSSQDYESDVSTRKTTYDDSVYREYENIPQGEIHKTDADRRGDGTAARPEKQ